MIKNYLNAARQNLEKSHDGKGPYALYEIWGKDDFKSNCDFIDRVTIPANSEVGYHKHGNNEEMYIVLEGQGTMIIGGKKQNIKKGDMVLNPAFGEHGLINDSDHDIELLVIQISLTDQ